MRQNHRNLIYPAVLPNSHKSSACSSIAVRFSCIVCMQVGASRMDNLQKLLAHVLKENIPGDMVECGVRLVFVSAVASDFPDFIMA